MRILVCGGRNYGYTPESGYSKKEYEVFRKAIELLADMQPTFLIQGGAKGADEVAGLVHEALGTPQKIYKADWKKYGKAAGPIRNKQMLEEGKPDLVVAFPGGTGTADMIKQAKAAGVEVIEVK